MPPIELTLIQPNAAPRKLRFDSDQITMGRSNDCLLPIEDRYLSRRHAELAFDGRAWRLIDRGSANGTFVNGIRIDGSVEIKPGDRIALGQTEVVLDLGEESRPQLFMSQDRVDLTTSVPLADFTLSERTTSKASERMIMVNRLAMQLIEDRPMSELFDFIVDRVMELMKPSRAALALLQDDGETLDLVELRRSDDSDSLDLTISSTMLKELIEDRKVLMFDDVATSAKLAEAQSIIGQSIRSVLCAPLLVRDSVLGLLYIDFRLSTRLITEEDVELAGQIARVAAIKLESTRLREAALEKERLDETLRLAQEIQMRMLPRDIPPRAEGSLCDIRGELRPARHVGGDFYDFLLTDDDRLYFCIGDVSGKGVPAALMMAVSRALFRSRSLSGGSPREIMSDVNRQLCDETDATMFVTAFSGVLDLASGELRSSNGGHNPPFLIRSSGTVEELPTETGLVLGYLPTFNYSEQITHLAPGDALYLYTDGISEATDGAEQLFGVDRLREVIQAHAGEPVTDLANATLEAVARFVAGAPQSDDLTLLCLRYLRTPSS